jgi:N-acetylglucosamine kinase-like BadF-type ATPase
MDAKSKTSLVLGVDGGGTKTACVIMDSSHRVLGRGEAGASNWHSVGPEAARRNTAAAIHMALAAAGSTPAALSAACLGMGGVERPGDLAQVESWVQEFLPGVPATIHNDAVVALTSGTGGEIYGVVLICGTGMIVFGYDADGRVCRSGGWGALLGDPGSGYAIGAAALQAVTWAVDGRGPSTTLEQAVLSFLKLAQPMDLIDWAYSDVAWHRFARLAPLTLECARQGDGVAQQIVEQAAAGLAVAVEVVVHKLQLEASCFPLVLAGGNMGPGLLTDTLYPYLRRIAPHATIIRPQVEPAVGAALLALHKMNPGER